MLKNLINSTELRIEHQNYYEEKFLNYMRYKEACGREETLNKIWN